VPDQLAVQQHLRSGNTLDSLTTLCGINVKRHPAYPHLVHLSYDQLESPKAHPIVLECRGLILDESNDWNIVAYPFSRFFNYGEPTASEIDWRTARVQEKVDGSMLVMWFYDGMWNVSTKGSPDAGGQVGDFSLSFSELFWQTFEKTFPEINGSNIDQYFDKNTTYVWELTSFMNRVVCSYGKGDKIQLIGVRDLVTLRELPTNEFRSWFPVVREYSLMSADDIIAAAAKLDPLENEGYVVVDDNFNRVKIKSPKYVLIHHMKDGFGQRRIIDLIKLGETSEVLTYFPDYVDLWNDIEGRMTALVSSVEAEYERIKDIPVQKDFALEAVQNKCSGAMFSVRKGQMPSIKAAIYQIPADKLENLIGLKAKAPVSVE
jgi:hypothetical protein